MVFHPKSQPAPECLAIEKTKKSGTYNQAAVVEQLKLDFKNKCYVCENKEPHSINIEHFVPHKGDIDLMFDWDNLFYCCAHCNNIKLAISKYDNILNCTIETDYVDSKIKYVINPFPGELVDISAIENSVKVNNTVDLLKAVYNGTTAQKKIESANIRSKLLKEIRKFQDLLFEFDDDSYNDEEKEDIKKQIIRHLRATSNFTAFKKWIIWNSELFKPIFEMYT